MALIRYIDAFKEDLSGGRDVLSFLQDVMGLTITLPDAILSQVENQQKIVPALQLIVPTALGRMEIKFSEGNLGNQQAIVMDSSLQIPRDIGASCDDAIGTLTEGREVIHELFRNLTAKIHDDMEPIS